MPRSPLAVPLALLALLAGCTDPARRPAEEAIQGTEKTLAAARADATLFIPERLKPVDEALARAKDAFGKGDFKGALASAKDLPAQAAQVAALAAARRDDLGRDYSASLAQLPHAFEAIRSRLAELEGQKKLPKGFTPAVIAAAREELAQVTRDAAAAEAKATSGDLTGAAAAAHPVKARTLALAGRLGLSWGTAPK